MEVVSVPLGSVTIGAQAWRGVTERSITKAERLVRETRAGAAGATSRPHTSTASVRLPEETRGDEGTTAGKSPQEGSRERPETSDKTAARPQTTGATFPSFSRWSHGGAPFPCSSFRERCAGESAAVAGGYMRRVREVERVLRRQAARVSQEGLRLERERVHLERTLRDLRTNLNINHTSREQRTGRPATAETISDAADDLLLDERRELLRLKQHLEGTLQTTLTQIHILCEVSGQLLECASERARVLELVPLSGSGRGATAQSFTKTHPTSPFTPECKQVLDRSSSSITASQQLRDTIRQALHSAIYRQRVVHQRVNQGLLKKVAETISLQQSLSVTSGATRQAIFRKQREMDCIRLSHGTAQGPEYSGDVLSREKLDRPLVQVYHRHPGTHLQEAAHLIQGSALLSRCLSSCVDDFGRLHHSRMRLQTDLLQKRTAAAVDSAVLRMRRRQVDKRAVPMSLQQDALKSLPALSCMQ